MQKTEKDVYNILEITIRKIKSKDKDTSKKIEIR